MTPSATSTLFATVVDRADMLSAPQAARHLGVSPGAIYRWTRTGELAAVRVPSATGDRVFLRFTTEDLDAFADARSRRHGNECPIKQRPFDIGKSECQCILCHCGSDHQPGGFLGSCQRCGRKRREDLRT